MQMSVKVYKIEFNFHKIFNKPGLIRILAAE